MIFSSFTDPVTIKRLTQTADKSAYVAVSGTLYGLFIPVDQDQNVIALKIVGQAYKFSTDGVNDIRPGDIVTYLSEEYGVKGTQKLTQKSLSVLLCYLEKRQKYA